MNAMYEKKLALQAESYMQLKIAYEELSQVLLRAVEPTQPPRLFIVPLLLFKDLSHGQLPFGNDSE